MALLAVSTVSRTSAGNCAAGGSYQSALGSQAFVVNETHGDWGSAHEVAGSLNTANIAGVNSVSCTSTGSCSGGGSYFTSHGSDAFVTTEKN